MVQANGYLVVLDEFGFMTYSLDCRDPLPIEIAGPSPGSQTKANKLSVSPNPFNPMTEMVFNLDAPSDVTLRVFDLSGRLVRELSRGAMSKGLHSVVWNGKDDAGCPMSAGVYVGRLDVGDRVFSQKLSLIK